MEIILYLLLIWTIGVFPIFGVFVGLMLIIGEPLLGVVILLLRKLFVKNKDE